MPKSGHAPGHVRDAFLRAIDPYLNWSPGQPEPTVDLDVNYVPRPIPISKACTLVWNCTDIMPGADFDRLRDDAGLEMKRRTYAACARQMYESIKT